MFVDGHASGNADQLGKYTATFKATVNLDCGCSQGDSIQFIAANGDSLYGLGQGIGVPDKPGFNRVTQTYTIMGGTGRFVGATGNIVVIRLANGATGVSSDLSLPASWDDELDGHTVDQAKIEAYYQGVRVPRIFPLFEAKRQGDIDILLFFHDTTHGYLLFEAAIGDGGYSSGIAAFDLRCN